MEIKDIAGFGEIFKRVLDSLEKGISSILSPYVYKQMERAKLLIEQEHSEQNAIVALKEAMTQDMIAVCKTTRDRNELHNIVEIYGGAIAELQNFDTSKLPAHLPSNEWAAHFYDCAKDCSDEEIRILWAKILSGEIKSPGKYFKRTLTYLKQIEKHEAAWFVELCKYSVENCYIPSFVLQEGILPINQYQSLVDCGFVNASDCAISINTETVFSLKGRKIKVVPNDVYTMRIMTFTDTGMQMCELINVEADTNFISTFIDKINNTNYAVASEAL